MVDIERWRSTPLHMQLGNIGSEISRTLNLKNKESVFTEDSFYRSLELIDLTIKSHTETGLIRELCWVRELLCHIIIANDVDYFCNIEPLKRYFDSFTLLSRRSHPSTV